MPEPAGPVATALELSHPPTTFVSPPDPFHPVHCGNGLAIDPDLPSGRCPTISPGVPCPPGEISLVPLPPEGHGPRSRAPPLARTGPARSRYDQPQFAFLLWSLLDPPEQRPPDTPVPPR